jgi:aminoglycoside phosphotransferase (APT) family kinase protein
VGDEAHAGVPGELPPPRRLGGSRGAAVWEIATPAGPRAVKVAARGRTSREARALAAVSGVGVAPRLVASGDGLLVTERIDGEVRPAVDWSIVDARAVGALLRRLHDAGVPVSAVSGGAADGVAIRAEELQSRVDIADRPLAAQAIAAMTSPVTAPAVVLHGDPWSGNVVWGDDGPLLVDWEFARIGEPAEDLAYLAAMDTLAPTALAALLAGYGADAATADRVAALRPFMALWCADWYSAVGEPARGARLRAHAAGLVAGMAEPGPGGARI